MIQFYWNITEWKSYFWYLSWALPWPLGHPNPKLKPNLLYWTHSALNNRSLQKVKSIIVYFRSSFLEIQGKIFFSHNSRNRDKTARTYSGHLRSDFVVLLLLLTTRSRKTRKADQKCPEKQDKKSQRDMKNKFPAYNYLNF